MGSSVCVSMKCYKKFPTSNYFNIDVTDVQYLNTVRENAIQKLTISIPASVLMPPKDAADDTENFAGNIAEDLNTLISKQKGPTELYLQLTDAETGKAITLRARDTITVHNALIDFVKQQESWTYSVN